MYVPYIHELIEGDVFRMIVKYPDSQIYEEAPELRPASEAPVTPEVTPEVRKMLSIMTGEMTRGEIQEKLGLRDEKHFRENYQQVGVKLSLIEMTIPDKPRSSKQKYRLT
ncbi:MAG: hypothetical protein KAI86_09920, partial [Desulfobacterales bacterium]|nr:hypothetical protein [Desulfobacterales bacterium]